MRKIAKVCKSPSAAALMGVVAGSLLIVSGPAVGDPQSKPTITLAPYVLESTDLRRGATNAYRPWFENGAWTGDLIQYHISEQGERCTSVAVGEFPADDSGNSANCDHNNWSARGVFPDKIVGGDGTLVDEPAAGDYWRTRNVFTYIYDSVLDKPVNTPFWWDELSPAQKHALDPVTCGLDIDGVCAAQDVDQDDPEASIVLNFLRGDRSAELDKPGGIFRLRYSLLGAIINSRPAYLNVNDGLVVVGANDGIVHGFDASSGQELFGYVPSVFMSSLETLTRSPFSFRYFADGELRARNIREDFADSSFARRDIVTGGFGAGGKGLFALEVSNPADPKILFELSGTVADYIDGEYLSSLGHIYGRPTIARLPDGNWYVVAGNGHGSGAGARLLLIRLTGNPAGVDYVVSEIIADASAGNGLSAPALVSSTDDFSRVDYAYAGDEYGNLYRFNLTNRTSSTLFSAGANKPITVEPDIARHPTQIGVMVYFGTGRLFEQADAITTATQSIYGIWDETFTGGAVVESELLQKQLVQETGTWGGTERTVRIIIGSADPNDPNTERQPVWEGDNKHRGWRVDLPIDGERLLGRPQVRANRLQFISTNPVSDPQSTAPGDGSWFNQLSLASGGSLNPPVPLYDLDRSGVLDDDDAIEVEVDINGVMVPTSFFPLSLNLGPGNIAQPAFASVAQDIDAIFINALLLPPPPEPPFPDADFGGDIDVTTDSPSGPLVNPHDPSHPEYSLYGTTYPDPSHPNSPPARGPMNIHLGQDGLGNRVDGHHRAYEKVHGVKYVDYFNLEPRRGRVRLDPGPLDGDGNPFIAIQELNGPTDKLPDSDGSGGGLMFDEENQKFIVVLANADLSQGTEIQIGCRTWETFDYQEMITPQLKAGTPPNDLVDENGESLVFTLNSIRADTGCTEPTLRITVTGRVGSEGVLHGTLPGCVNNTHNWNGDPKTASDPQNPHITPNQEQQSSGYRWRNGALTMQLLAVEPDGTAGYVLQTSNLPESRRTIGNGGIFALGFTVTGNGQPVVSPVDGPNGLLYESSVFWNFGDMWEFQQQGQGVKCYGASAYNAALVNEIFGLNSGQYNGLVSNLRIDDALLADYEAALAALANAQTEAELTAALLNLAALFNRVAGSWGAHGVLTLADHYRLRGYAHQAQFNLDLLDIDRQIFEPPPPVDVGIDGTPANVSDIELDLLPAAGPNYQPGRRSWVDLTPE